MIDLITPGDVLILNFSHSNMAESLDIDNLVESVDLWMRSHNGTQPGRSRSVHAHYDVFVNWLLEFSFERLLFSPRPQGDASEDC